MRGKTCSGVQARSLPACHVASSSMGHNASSEASRMIRSKDSNTRFITPAGRY